MYSTYNTQSALYEAVHTCTYVDRYIPYIMSFGPSLPNEEGARDPESIIKTKQKKMQFEAGT